jgi:predicted unusual protein kinase regulating ubiquinone biosynthesis (AarF/ABC1/UbiB family)
MNQSPAPSPAAGATATDTTAAGAMAAVTTATVNYEVDRLRYLRVVWFFAGVFTSFIWWDLLLRRVPGVRGFAQRSAAARWQATARRFRRLAVQMGGVLIKLGQFLSIRVDVLPEVVTSELAGLQDEVPSESFADIQAVIAGSFGRPADQVFAWLAPAPEAAASLAQVHRARLPDGQEVVAKIQRPRIGQTVATDLAAIRVAIRWLKWYPPISRRVDLDRLYDEFAAVTRAELDFVAEGKNAEHFAADFKDDPGICIARVYWDFTSSAVLTLENVASLKITDFPALEAAGISRAQVARRLYDTYLKQIFVTNFVHADPHPGNLFIQPLPQPAGAAPDEPAPFQLIFIDFGMVAVIPPAMRSSLREYIIALGTRDAHGIVQAYVHAGVLLPGADLRRLEALHEELFRRFAGIRMGQLANAAFEQGEAVFREYRDILHETPFQFPTDILFAGRAVGILSGLATSLDPEFDPWEAMLPFAERLATAEAGQGVLEGLAQVAKMARLVVGLPGRMDRFLSQAERGDLVVQTALAPDTARQARRLERAVDRLAWAVVFAGLLLGGVLLRGEPGSAGLSTVLLIGSAIALVWGLTRR